jgi:hypothetical protein
MMADKIQIEQGINYKAKDIGSGVFARTTAPVAASISQKTADGEVKATAGVVYAVVASGVGVTAGDTAVLKDDTTAVLTFVFAAANETIVFNPPVGVTFATSIQVDITKSGGTMTVDVVYI